MTTETMRAETGTIRFGSDWTGVFIRGDDAFVYSQVIKMVLTTCSAQMDRFTFRQVEGLLSLLSGCTEPLSVDEEKEVHKLKEFVECLR